MQNYSNIKLESTHVDLISDVKQFIKILFYFNEIIDFLKNNNLQSQYITFNRTLFKFSN